MSTDINGLEMLQSVNQLLLQGRHEGRVLSHVTLLIQPADKPPFPLQFVLQPHWADETEKEAE